MTDDELFREAREEAERRLDQILTVLRDELNSFPKDRRWEFMVRLMARMEVDPFVLKLGYVLACERILLKEELDHDLSSSRE